MADNKQEVANRLLDGLVEHLLAKLSPAQLDGLIEQELDYALDVATRYTPVSYTHLTLPTKA